MCAYICIYVYSTNNVQILFCRPGPWLRRSSGLLRLASALILGRGRCSGRFEYLWCLTFRNLTGFLCPFVPLSGYQSLQKKSSHSIRRSPSLGPTKTETDCPKHAHMISHESTALSKRSSISYGHLLILLPLLQLPPACSKQWEVCPGSWSSKVGSACYAATVGAPGCLWSILRQALPWR